MTTLLKTIQKEDLKLQEQKKDIMDRIFPLFEGSHHEVVNYEIDYSHLMVYFSNGQHTSIRDQGMFVAYKGKKEKPESLLFKTDKGLYVEVVLRNKIHSDYKLHYAEIEGIYFIYKIEGFIDKSGFDYKEEFLF